MPHFAPSAPTHDAVRRPRHKTLAAWLAFLLGSLGAHRFYLRGPLDILGWLLPMPTALGLWGLHRALTLGQDDKLSWLLLPLLGLSLAVHALTGIVYALTERSAWNARHNPGLPRDHPAGGTNGLTVTAVVLALLFGTIAFMSGLVYGFQRYFEYQIDEALKISQ